MHSAKPTPSPFIREGVLLYLKQKNITIELYLIKAALPHCERACSRENHQKLH